MQGNVYKLDKKFVVSKKNNYCISGLQKIYLKRQSEGSLQGGNNIRVWFPV